MNMRSQISQMTAMLIEHARFQGVSELELQRAINEEDVDFLNQISGDNFHYDGLFDYAKQHGEALETAILKGYQMKFNTLTGLQTVLKNKFYFEENIDYQVENHEIIVSKMTDKEIQRLMSLIATNWRISPQGKQDGEEEQTVVVHLNTLFA
ncbi:hypothetical protein EPH95_15975 [Salicibibacter halophilus]|uniref:Uncharacterized protein n=1 Tax=Salicibibacter halophilus TaxID=2502791 RepID=A0A514LMK4_9BACI|nr:hypothetical protein [Salicibibacter halophilus]QDI92501.1 hypothetical protein EPH95_15975 [Salicibibacter halophilus]